MEIKVREMMQEDMQDVVRVHQECFPDDNPAIKDMSATDQAVMWVRANFSAFPRMQYFVAEGEHGEIVGYILWMEKGGFRHDAVLELEQIGVAASARGGGVGSKIVRESLVLTKRFFEGQGRRLKLVEVTTGTENAAQQLYRKTMGAEVECVIRDFFAGDEAIMIARNP